MEWFRGVPVQVIIGAGERPEDEERAERAAKVQKRYLESQEWYGLCQVDWEATVE